MVQAAVVCRVSDSVFAIVVESSARPSPVRRNLERCFRRATLGCVFGRQCGARSSDVAEVEADEFKPSVIGAARVSYHFIRRRVLRTASEYAWSLARGDIEET